jgi:hypothetical protein
MRGPGAVTLFPYPVELKPQRFGGRAALFASARAQEPSDKRAECKSKQADDNQ